jgi:hypothetical protein
LDAGFIDLGKHASTMGSGDDRIHEDMSVSEKDLPVADLPTQVEYFIDEDEDRAVLRKIDWVVMPTMMVVLFFQCMSPTSFAEAIEDER